MEKIIGILAAGVPVLAVIVLVALVVVFGYVKAPPDVAYIISGVRKNQRILVGKAGIKIPFFERLDKLALGAIQIDVKTGSSVPTAEYINVRIDSTVSVRVSQDPALMKIAAQNFLNVPREEIARKVNDLLEGNIREIAGSMKLTEMVSDRKKFSEQVQENAVPDLQRFGLELVSFNVQNFVDDNDVITNLGIDNVEQIRKAAMIAKSNAQREVAIAEAENAKQANDAKVKAAEEIAVRNNDLAIKKAQLQKISDTEQAQADAAAGIEAENQRKVMEVAAANANIAKAERETELKRQQIELKERELDALVRKQADAEKYAAEKKAEAELITRQKKAEAERYEKEQEAEAMKAQADAAKYAAMAEAEGIAAKGRAEAEAIEKKAEAQKLMGEASVVDMILQTLPEMTAAAAAPLANVDTMNLYGEGNGGKVVGDVMKITNQVMEGLAANGINVIDIINKAMERNR
ncbi:MAG: flotillin family protein [Firmicutes bacterium]|nr:flotillin family protein [Bacillota bacterium]